MKITDWSLDIAPRSQKDRKFFTLEQANRSLVLVQRIVGDVVDEYQRLLELEDLIEAAEQSGSRRQLEDARQQLVNTVDVLQGCLEELDTMGVELRDFSRGIVDFPSRHDERPISLCWMHGEETVRHWHEVGASFACRQPISLLRHEYETQTTDLLV